MKSHGYLAGAVVFVKAKSRRRLNGPFVEGVALAPVESSFRIADGWLNYSIVKSKNRRPLALKSLREVVVSVLMFSTQTR